MPRTAETEIEMEQEPIGIVISRGTRAEATPRFLAYVWGEEEKPTPAQEPTVALVK